MRSAEAVVGFMSWRERNVCRERQHGTFDDYRANNEYRSNIFDGKGPALSALGRTLSGSEWLVPGKQVGGHVGAAIG